MFGNISTDFTSHLPTNLRSRSRPIMAKVEGGNADPRTNIFTASMYRRCSVDNASLHGPCSRCGSSVNESQCANHLNGGEQNISPSKPTLDEIFRASSWSPPIVPAGTTFSPDPAPPTRPAPDMEGLFRASTLRTASARSAEERASGGSGSDERTSSAGSRTRSKPLASHVTGKLTETTTYLSSFGKNLKRKLSKHKIRQSNGPFEGSGAAGVEPLEACAYPKQLLPVDYVPHRPSVSGGCSKGSSNGVVMGEVDRSGERVLKVKEFDDSESDDDEQS